MILYEGMKVTVYYPNDPDSDTRWSLYQGVAPEGLHYYKVWEGEVEDPNLDKVFHTFNTDRKGLKCRSMGVGDMVEIGGDAYLCDRQGFRKVSTPKVSEPSNFGW